MPRSPEQIIEEYLLRPGRRWWWTPSGQLQAGRSRLLDVTTNEDPGPQYYSEDAILYGGPSTKVVRPQTPAEKEAQIKDILRMMEELRKPL